MADLTPLNHEVINDLSDQIVKAAYQAAADRGFEITFLRRANRNEAWPNMPGGGWYFKGLTFEFDLREKAKTTANGRLTP